MTKRLPAIKPGTLFAATCVDWVLGDPQGMPHPVRLIGRAVTTGERVLRRTCKTPSTELFGGGILTAVVVTGSWAAAHFMIRRARAAGNGCALSLEILLAWTTLASRSLIDEAGLILESLEDNDLNVARQRLSMVVGRDTADLDETEIARAVIETVAESLCDGVIAPLMYLVLVGVPGAFAYKAVNTLDSMIGHPEPPYKYLGRIAARLDDAANFIPARVTAAFIVASALVMGRDWRNSWRLWRRDGGHHPSPNAGQSEAAMAGALHVRLGGMNRYQGMPSHKPNINGEGRPATRIAARASLRVAAVTSLLASTIAILWCAWRHRGKHKP